LARYEKEGPDKKGNFRIRDTQRDAVVKDGKGRAIRKYEGEIDEIIDKLEEKPFEGIYEDNPKYGDDQ
jgi:predicted transcriptional regulator